MTRAVCLKTTANVLIKTAGGKVKIKPATYEAISESVIARLSDDDPAIRAVGGGGSASHQYHFY